MPTPSDADWTAVNSAGFPAPAGIYAVPVVLAPLSGRLHVLLVQRAEAPFAGTWVLPGGFMSPSERPEETAQRKLTEKTGVGAVYLEQLETYGDPQRDPRGWIPTVAYLALIDAAVLRAEGSGARWEPVDALPPLGFDHARIVVDAVERLRGKLWWSNIAVGLLPRAVHHAPGAAGVRGDQRRDLRTVELPARAGAVRTGARHRHACQRRSRTSRGDVRVRRAATRLEPPPLAASGDAATPRLSGNGHPGPTQIGRHHSRYRAFGCPLPGATS